MPTTKIHWNLIFFVFLIVLLAAWTTTQWTAWRPGFQSELAPSRFEAPGVFTFYFPLIFFGGGTLSEITDPRFYRMRLKQRSFATQTTPSPIS